MQMTDHKTRSVFEREGEIFELYADCRVVLSKGCVLEDEPAGGIRDRHTVIKIVAQKLSGGCV